MTDNHFAALRACGWSREEARKILRDAKKGDTWAKADISRALADRKPANGNVDPEMALAQFIMFGVWP